MCFFIYFNCKWLISFPKQSCITVPSLLVERWLVMIDQCVLHCKVWDRRSIVVTRQESSIAESLWPSKVQGFFTVQGFFKVFLQFRFFFSQFKVFTGFFKPRTLKKNLELWKKTLNCEKKPWTVKKTLKKPWTVKKTLYFAGPQTFSY